MIERAFQFLQCSEAPCATRGANLAPFLVDGNSQRRHTSRSRLLLLHFGTSPKECGYHRRGDGTENEIVTAFLNQDLTEAKRSSFREASSSFVGWHVRPAHLLMQAVRDQTAGTLQKFSIFFAKRVQLVALHVHHSENALVVVVPHRDNDLRPRRMKRREMARILVYVADNDRFSRL